ncbi:hypothetical protein ICY_05107 [Bacillus cereus BAG2X1-3]|nr:hypothetical protein ICY_05107 [Bacillus cereus BAG2X1-3]
MRSMLGFKSYETAISILSSVETMHMMRKGQLQLQVKSAKVKLGSYVNCLELHHNLPLSSLCRFLCLFQVIFAPEPEEGLTKILPHSILKEDQSSAVIIRATDFMNSSHPYLVSSKRAQRENDIKMQMIGGLGLF